MWKGWPESAEDNLRLDQLNVPSRELNLSVDRKEDDNRSTVVERSDSGVADVSDDDAFEEDDDDNDMMMDEDGGGNNAQVTGS